MADTEFIIIMQVTLQFTHTIIFSDLHWDIAKMMQEYYEVHQMKYRDVYYNKTMIIYTGVKPAITNANAKPALNR